MLDGLFTSQIDDLQHALGRTTQRQALLMGNMANVNVPGYKRQDMDFHVALQGKMYEHDQHKIDKQDDDNQSDSDQTSIRIDGNNVDVEKEVASISETELHFSALSSITNNYFTNLKNVIREGK